MYTVSLTHSFVDEPAKHYSSYRQQWRFLRQNAKQHGNAEKRNNFEPSGKQAVNLFKTDWRPQTIPFYGQGPYTHKYKWSNNGTSGMKNFNARQRAILMSNQRNGLRNDRKNIFHGQNSVYKYIVFGKSPQIQSSNSPELKPVAIEDSDPVYRGFFKPDKVIGKYYTWL